MSKTPLAKLFLIITHFFLFAKTASATDFGFNIFNLAQYQNVADIEKFIDFVKSSCGTTIIRFWGFEDPGVAGIQRVLQAGSGKGVKFIISLADFNGKNSDWFVSGRQPHANYSASVVAAVRGNPDVLALEIANEPHCTGGSCEIVQFMDVVSASMRQAGWGGLISPGMKAFPGEDLGDGTFEQVSSLSQINANSCHYYSTDNWGTSGCATAKTILNNKGKYFYVGEAGIALDQCKDDQCNNLCSASQLTPRKDQFASDMASINPDAYLVWQFNQQRNSTIYCDSFSVFENDPMCGGGGGSGLPAPPPWNPPPPNTPITGEMVCRDGITGLGGGAFGTSTFSDRTVNYFKDLGVTYTRFTALWDNAESWDTYPAGEPKFDFTQGDVAASAMKASGVKDAIALFVGPSWWYADGDPNSCSAMTGSGFANVSSFCICYRFQECEPGGEGHGKWCGTQAHREEESRNPPLYCGISQSKEGLYRKAIQTIVGHYYTKFGLKLWEFWNEPENYHNGFEPNDLNGPKNYAWALKVFYEEAKKFLGVRVAFNANWDHYGPVMDTKTYDAAVIHPYTSQPATEAINKDAIDNLRSGLASVGKSDAKIWITEWGYEILGGGNCNFPITSEASQASLYKEARDWLSMQSDIEYAIFFILDDKPQANAAHPYGPGDNVCYGMIKEDFWNPTATPTKRPVYDVFKNKTCSYTVSAGTCEDPLKFYSKPSCETLAVKSPMNRVSFTIVPGKDQELDDVGNPNPLARIWKRTFKVRFEKDWTKDNSVYKLDPSHSEYYLFDNDPNKFVIRHFTGVPAPGNEKFVTAVTQGVPKNNKWGLFNYLLSPSFTTNYINGQFRDLAKKETGFLDRASAVMLSKGNIKIIAGDKSGVSVVPQTQNQLGGSRLEKKELALNFFATQKVACSIMGRPGDTYCDFRSGINDFNLFASSIANDFGTFSGEQLAVAIPNSGSDLSCGSTAGTSKLLASSVPFGTLSVSKDSSLQGDTGLNNYPPHNTAQTEGQVLGIFDNVSACYTLKTTSEKLECPYPGKVYPNKDKLDIKGKSIKEMECTETNSGIIGTPGAGYPRSPGCSADAELMIQHDTVYGFESPSMDLSESLVKSLTFGPATNSKMAYQTEFSGVGERKHNEVRVSTDIQVKSSDKAYVIKGTTLSCEYQFLTASINNSPAHPYSQPDPNCFEKEQPPQPPRAECGRNVVAWDNRSAGIPIPTGQKVSVCGVITPANPFDLSMRMSPCGNGDTPFYNLSIEHPDMNVSQTLHPEDPSKVAYNFQVPVGAKVTIEARGLRTAWGATWTTIWTGQSPATEQTNCKEAYIFHNPLGKDGDGNWCGVTQNCRDMGITIDMLRDKWKGHGDWGDRCVNGLGWSVSSDGVPCIEDFDPDKGDQEIASQCRGRAWACYNFGPDIVEGKACAGCPPATTP
jgi:hypothetical protein